MLAGRGLPDKIKNAPELFYHLRFFMQAFHELDTERTEGPIPWSRIMQYADRYELDSEEAEELRYYTRVLDDAVMKHRSKTMQDKLKRSEKPSGKHRRR